MISVNMSSMFQVNQYFFLKLKYNEIQPYLLNENSELVAI